MLVKRDARVLDCVVDICCYVLLNRFQPTSNLIYYGSCFESVFTATNQKSTTALSNYKWIRTESEKFMGLGKGCHLLLGPHPTVFDDAEWQGSMT